MTPPPHHPCGPSPHRARRFYPASTLNRRIGFQQRCSVRWWDFPDPRFMSWRAKGRFEAPISGRKARSKPSAFFRIHPSSSISKPTLPAAWNRPNRSPPPKHNNARPLLRESRPLVILGRGTQAEYANRRGERQDKIKCHNSHEKTTSFRPSPVLLFTTQRQHARFRQHRRRGRESLLQTGRRHGRAARTRGRMARAFQFYRGRSHAMRSRRNRRKEARRSFPDEFAARPAQRRSTAEVERLSKLLAEIGNPSLKEGDRKI